MMRLFYKFGILGSLVISLLTSFLASNAHFVYANSGLTVEGALLVADVSPGEIIRHKMIVSIGSSDSAKDITIKVASVEQNLDGTYNLFSTPSNNGFSAYPYITLDKSSAHLEPGTSQEFTATVKIPTKVGDGGRYAVINIKTNPAGQGDIGVSSAINVPVYLTIINSQLIHEGRISGLTTAEPTSGKPLDILTTFENTGNHHFKVKGEVTITGGSEKVLDTIHMSLTPSSIVPDMSRQLRATFVPEGELPLGKYFIKSKITLEDGSLLDETNSSFEIKKPYVPPLAHGSVLLTPVNTSTLDTGDGRISIAFPRGAVTGEAQATLWSYPLDQLPDPPFGLKLATTCFRVNGLNGLLAKNATVTVKYSAADLEKARGDASKLILARWDEAAGKWSELKTSLNEEGTTLTASTNQFSIWVVMVGTSSSGANWTLIAVILGIVITALVAFVWMNTKRKRKT